MPILNPAKKSVTPRQLYLSLHKSPFERMKLYNFCPDISLRKAIITQAIIDASNTSDISEFKKIEIEAKNWIFGTNNTFDDTCIEADMDPLLVRKIAKEVIKLHRNAKLVSQKRSARKKHITVAFASAKRTQFNRYNTISRN